jgi:hypothetical protein
MSQGLLHRRDTLLAAALLCTIGGCASRSAPASHPVSRGEAKPAAKRVTARAADTDGSVLIVEYHNIAKKEARWDRSVNRFRSDLERLYGMGFRPVTVSAYLDDKMDLPPGASPIVFTFDDADPTQFRILPDGKIDPDCAVGIWQAFAKDHPDFPVVATFYVLPVLWNQKSAAARKLEMLRRWGCEIGCHTYTHRSLGTLSDAEVKTEIQRSVDLIASLGFKAETIALPYGVNPKNKELLKGFTANGKRYGFRAALLVGAGPAPSPHSPKLNPYRLPRIQGIEGDYGITYWLDKVKAGKVKPYVTP